MRPLALALLLLIPAAVRAQPAPDPLVEAFADGTPPSPAVTPERAAAVEAVKRLQAEWKARPGASGLAERIERAYALVVPGKDKPAILQRARTTYGLGGPAATKQELDALQAKMSRLPPGDKQREQLSARIGRLSAALGKSQFVDGAAGVGGTGSGAAGVRAGAPNLAARQTALADYLKAHPGPFIKIDKGIRPPLPKLGKDGLPEGTVRFDGVILDPKAQARVGAEVSNLRDLMQSDQLQGYVTPTDRKQITDAWGKAVAHNVDADGHVVNMKKTVNDFRDILLNGREAGDGTTRVAEHWGEMAVGTYSVGAWASIPASLAWNTFSITKGQLLRSWRYFRGDGPAPPAGNYWGETMNKSLVTESAAAGWASSLQGADHQRAIDGITQTLKLDDFAAYVKANGILTTAGQMKDRYAR